MWHKSAIVIQDILKDNNISPKHLYLVLDKGLRTVGMIKEVSGIADAKDIEKIAEGVESFMAILELANFYEERN